MEPGSTAGGSVERGLGSQVRGQGSSPGSRKRPWLPAHVTSPSFSLEDFLCDAAFKAGGETRDSKGVRRISGCDQH